MMLCKIQFRSEYALCIIRVVLGTVFLAHGLQKVLGLFGGSGLIGFVHYTTSLGAPEILGYLAASCELIGGILLFFGIFAEVGALLVIPVMIGAIYLVHGSHGFFGQNGGYEYPLVLIGMALAIIIGGPGYYAVWPQASCGMIGCDCITTDRI